MRAHMNRRGKKETRVYVIAMKETHQVCPGRILRRIILSLSLRMVNVRIHYTITIYLCISLKHLGCMHRHGLNHIVVSSHSLL